MWLSLNQLGMKTSTPPKTMVVCGVMKPSGQASIARRCTSEKCTANIGTTTVRPGIATGSLMMYEGGRV